MDVLACCLVLISLGIVAWAEERRRRERENRELAEQCERSLWRNGR